ncbi:MAG: 4-hydroxy-tetrahydrodipicolinate synthase [Paludibacteraceae bacterium]|nr:4-hydroxy-tetrahydrodipicolinate synthase [Paludibacteraceae bacterium]
MARLDLKGLGIALITPFKQDGSVDFDSLGRLLDYQLKNGADYLVVLGTTGETPTLTENEKDEIKRFIVEKVNHKVPLILGCGGNCTSSVVEQAKHVNPAEFDAILTVAPFYNKPSQEGLYQHYKAIAEASPVPVVLYNVPGRTGVNIAASTTLRLARDFENIIAVKEASGNMSQIDEIIENKPKDFVVISGDDGITFPLITLGAVGVISVIGNAFPAEFSKMVRLALNGDYESARKIHRQFSELFSLLFVDGNPAGVKSMLSMMGFVENRLRLPLVPTTLTTYDKIKFVLEKLNIKIG